MDMAMVHDEHQLLGKTKTINLWNNMNINTKYVAYCSLSPQC